MAAWDKIRRLVDPTANLTIAFKLAPDLARRAGLTASGQPVIAADDADWASILGPVREHMGRSPLSSVAADPEA